MTTNDWQSRLLSDDELQHILANLGALDGMQVLQRQLELRSLTHEDSDDLRGEVSSHLELGLTDVVQIVDEAAIAQPLPKIDAAPLAQPSIATASQDIAGSLNALFAARQQVTFEPVAPIPVSDSPHEVPQLEIASGSYNPLAVESNTQSFFIPTFANPLPGTESIEVVTPMAQPVDPAKLSPAARDGQTTGDQTVADFPRGEAEAEPVPTAETPVAATVMPGTPIAQWESNLGAGLEIPSAEEAITAFEEADTTSTAQPNLVDEVILSVGGQLEEPFSAPQAELAEALSVSLEPSQLPVVDEGFENIAAAALDESIKPVAEVTPAKPNAEKRLKSGLGKLIATWNGTGNLLFLIAAGYFASTLNFSLATVLVGSFGALAVTGFGFGTAALSAKRGSQPQATLSRAAFGVRAAAIPLAVVTIAGYAATSLASTSIVTGLHFFYPALPEIFLGMKADYLILAGLLLIAAVATVFDGARRLLMTRLVAYVSLAWIVAVLVFANLSSHRALELGSLNSQQSLALASVLLIVISVIWGTSAADETPNLAQDVHPAKLLATGLLSHSIIGSLAVWAGFSFAQITLSPLLLQILGAIFALAAVAALSHQVRRIADSYSGFGLVGTRWWVVVGSLIIVAAGTVSMWLFVPGSILWPAVVSLLPVAGVPVIAWLATYGVDTVLRRDDYHEVSLMRDYGFYGRLRVVNLAGWVLATIAGLGFVESSVPGFTWLGYLAHLLGYSATGLQADTGVWIAFAVGVVAPLFTVGSIRQQEAEGRALASRHKDLINVLGEL